MEQATAAIDEAVEQLEKKHQGLLGVVVLRSGDGPAVLRSTFADAARTLQIATLAHSVLEAAQQNLADGDSSVTLLRVRTQTSEVVVTPDRGFVLVAVHSIKST